ncbi:MAG: hypothetical protein V1883_03040 [Candidatus Omnitrophota bacterium]
MNTKTILKKIIFLPLFLILFLCFERASIANAGETVSVILSKGDKIRVVRDNPFEGGAPYWLRMKVGGSCGEQDVPMCGWSYTALGDGEELNFSVEAYEQPGGAFAGKAVVFHREPNSDPIYPVPPGYTDGLFVAWVFPSFEAPLHAQAGYDFFVEKPIRIVVKNDNRESIIDTTPPRYATNYREKHPVTIIAFREDSITGKLSLYRGTEPIELKMTLKGVADGVNSELVFGGGLGYGGVDDENFINWKGYYYAGGGEVEDSSNDGTQAGPQSVQFSLNKDLNPAVVVVCSWSTWKASVDFDVVLVSKPQDLSVDLHPEHEPVKTCFDNADLVRRDPPYNSHPDVETLLPPGTNFTDYPGPFVVKGIGRPYSEIVSILRDAEKGDGPWPIEDNGPDWMQVAAADIYNAPHPVFNCVWEIGTSPKTDSDGSISIATPYRVDLIASAEGYDIYAMRFNKNGKDGYGFYSYKDRDALILHEALHCYHLLPGPGVNDEEEPERYNDFLYVGSGRLHFSYDDKSRGFLRLNSEGNYLSTVDMLLAGRSGDSYMHINQLGDFILNLGSGQLLNPDLVEIIFDLNMPQDIPAGRVSVVPQELYLYNPSTHSEKSLGVESVNILNSGPFQINGANGYYNACAYSFHIDTPLPPSNLEEIWQLIEQGYTELYLWYGILYEDAPYEYDASAFGIGVTQ